ncbi:hypothetical protein L3Q82_025479 [Scortum barcoo]|uniref:Uncharacterized protein n=1 Tax=Scortum barcoo TaxID=214431 RepID=A0ACB8WP43_9TELE|nr:hypothetical protein L3Q82_025479 [Scortum barcoo]
MRSCGGKDAGTEGGELSEAEKSLYIRLFMLRIYDTVDVDLYKVICKDVLQGQYEFKVKNIKKKKVNIVVSVDGVKVNLRKKKKKKEWTWDESKMMVMQDPIYRYVSMTLLCVSVLEDGAQSQIWVCGTSGKFASANQSRTRQSYTKHFSEMLIFYVSHDSQDLKIFSYIARDGQSNVFRCNVFKSKKKLNFNGSFWPQQAVNATLSYYLPPWHNKHHKQLPITKRCVVVVVFMFLYRFPDGSGTNSPFARVGRVGSNMSGPSSASGQHILSPGLEKDFPQSPVPLFTIRAKSFARYCTEAEDALYCGPVEVCQELRGESSTFQLPEEEESLLSLLYQSQAMRIVRTVGQAFEVCHKLSLQHTQQNADGQEDCHSEKNGNDSSIPGVRAYPPVCVCTFLGSARELTGAEKTASVTEETDIDAEEVSPVPAAEELNVNRGVTDLDATAKTPDLNHSESKVHHPTLVCVYVSLNIDFISLFSPWCQASEEVSLLMSSPRMLLPVSGTLPPGAPLSVHHQIQLLQQQLQQQQQQTQVAVAQVHLLKDQLNAEATARLEAQARVHQLLLQNKDLLQHISLLVKQIQELETKMSGPNSMGSQDSLLEITFRSTVPAVICDPTTPKPDVSALNLPMLGSADGTSNAFSSSNGTLGSPLGRDQCLLKLECFRFLPGPPRARLPSPSSPLKANRPEDGEEASEGTATSLSRDVKSLGCVDFARFRESGIASEYESNTDDSDDREDEDEDDEEDMEIFGWGTDEETLRLLNVLNRQGTPDCLGDEIAVTHPLSPALPLTDSALTASRWQRCPVLLHPNIITLSSINLVFRREKQGTAALQHMLWETDTHHLCLLLSSLFSPVDQSMFENSTAQQQSPQTSRPGQPSARRSLASANPNLGSSSVDSPSSGGQQRLKNAINLGKAVGAKVNDLLRRKEPSHLGDIGVTEVNKSVGAVWSCLDQLNQTTANSHISSFDSFPRLDPPPPSGKKRLPRALKTTQDMMISSDPVVSSPDAAESSSFLSSPDKTPLIGKEELGNSEEQQQGEKEEEGSEEITLPTAPEEKKVAADWKTTESNGKVDGVTGGKDDDVENRSTEGGVEEQQTQLQLSVPDLINKDPPVLEPRAKSCDVWQKVSEPDSRLASTPRSGKTPCRISLGEEVLLGNGTGVSAEESEHHPDLLSFE